MSERIVRVKLSAQVSEYQKGMQDAMRATHELGTEAEKLAQKREAFNTLGTAAVAGGTAMVAMSVLAAKAAMDWESAWAGVTKTVEGTPEELAELEDGLRDLTAVLPASHDEIAAVAEAAGQLGVQTGSVVAFTKTMIDLGETTNLSADQAATSLAQFMNIMGTAGEDVGRLGSTIVALGNDGASTEAEIVQMAQRIAGSGKLVGATEGEVLALSNALASMGITAELGGGVASRILQDLYSAVETGGDKLASFAQVAGMSAQEFAAAFQNDPIRAMGAFATGLNGVEKSGGNVVQTLGDLGFKSTEEQRVLLQLKSAGDLLTDSLDLQNTAWAENTALADEAAKRYDTVESKVAIAGNAIREAAIEFGEAFLGPAGDAADAVSNIALSFAELPDPVQGAISILTGAVGVTALVGGAALLAVPKIAEFRLAMEVLGISGAGARASLGSMWKFLTGPYGIAMIAATTVVVGLSVAQDKLKTSTEEFQNVIKNAKSADDLFDAADAAVPFLSRLKEATASVETFRSKLDIIANNDFLRGLDGSAGQLKNSLREIGRELQTTAASDLPAAQKAFRMLVAEMELTGEEQQWLLDTMPEYKKALQEQATQAGVNTTTMSAAENAQALLNLALGGVVDPAAEAEAALAAVEEEAAEADAALTGTADALAAIASKALGMGEASDAALSALNALTEAAAAEGAALDGTNDSSIALRDTMREVEETHRASADAIIQETGSLADAQVEWQRGRDAVINMMVAKGMDREEAIRWADQNLGSTSEVKAGIDDVYAAWLNLPENRQTKYEVEQDEAARKLASLKSMLDAIPRHKFTRVTLTSYQVDGGRTVSVGDNETGNFYAYANGGIASNVPSGIYPGGAEIHKFAEKSLPWEAYISPKADQRDRNFGVWKEAGDRLGFLRGNQGQSTGSDQRPVQVTQHITMQPGMSVSQVESIAADRFSRALRGS